MLRQAVMGRHIVIPTIIRLYYMSAVYIISNGSIQAALSLRLLMNYELQPARRSPGFCKPRWGLNIRSLSMPARHHIHHQDASIHGTPNGGGGTYVPMQLLIQ